MPLQATAGAATYDAYGSGAAAAAANYIEDVFQTYLYTGNGSTQTITNGVDLAGQGGLVWLKTRNQAQLHTLTDTARGINAGYLRTNDTNAQSGSSWANLFTSFNSNGFSVSAAGGTATNESTYTYASWTFRKQPKFFDVVTYTGNGVNRTISHSLGSVPGCIIVKATSTTRAWAVYHRSLGATQSLSLNVTNAASVTPTNWNDTSPTASVFTLGSSGLVNEDAVTYVAYLFAHDAGGFGASGTDNVISCGSYTYSGGANPVITLGWEPQWLLRKRSDSAGNWELVDNMRGLPVSTTSAQPSLQPNLSAAESSATMYLLPNATGFEDANATTGATYIYIAIRRGPMRTPTTGTSVYAPITASTGSSSTAIVSNLVNDAVIYRDRGSPASFSRLAARLTGNNYLETTSTVAEATTGQKWDSQTTFTYDSATGYSTVNYAFRRAPGFFDVVCYTGTGVAGRTVAHNLGVVPELMIVKNRQQAFSWQVYLASLGNGQNLNLDSATLAQSSSIWNNTTPTSSVFSVSASGSVNGSATTYVAYLFATVAGVSKVGSYTGTGTTLQVNCGFTGGARFVLIKRTDSTGDWYVWDSARGIVAGSDPYLTLNTTAAEVTTTDWVDTYSAGFELSNAGGNNVNINGATYIFLSVA